MLLLTQGGLGTLARWQHPNMGRLVQPRNYARIRDTPGLGMVWAADNDAFSGGVDHDAYDRMLDACTGVPGCVFVTVPDVVGDAHATIGEFHRWHTAPLRRGLPVAFVAQDGMESLTHHIPWWRVDCLFVGGTDTWRHSSGATWLVRAAKRRGLWVHIGRVNSRRRYQHFAGLGADSFDGSGSSWYRDQNLPKYLSWTAEPVQLPLIA